MIHFAPVPEPEGFDVWVRQPGNQWLAEHPEAKRPKPLWTRFQQELCNGFQQYCAYLAQWIPQGEIDHFQSISRHPELTYEWVNYRYTCAQMNRFKGNEEILDPFEVEDGWFEIILPSLQLVMTDRIPLELRDKARFTLVRLHLGHDERVIRTRQKYYQLYQEGKLSLQGLYELAPLIARAVEKQEYH